MRRFLPFVFLPLFSFAEESSKIDSGNTAWMLVATALVMLMTPAGLAIFYGGMSRSKNILNTIAMSFLAFCITSLIWIFWGYSIAFGSDIFGIFGSLEHAFLLGININDILPDSRIPVLVFVLFQLTFAAITVALISGSIIERVKFEFWLIFIVLWVTFVYSPIAHWEWGGGFLSKVGILDFAGGLAIETASGIAGLVLAILLGRRRDYGKKAIVPSSVVLTTLGAALLWFGWFGFNAGSALKADGLATYAFLNTNTAAAVGALSWMFTEWFKFKKPTLLGVASGAVSGLVAITPAAGYVGMFGSIIIGAVAGIIGFVGVFWLKNKLKYDDSLDVFGVHGLNGIWGTLATGLFANPSINPGGKGLFFGNFSQVLVQLGGIFVVILYTAITTAILFFVVSFITKGARVSADEETLGLDEAIHGERGFEL
ncbi:ammonium transporter [Sulfurihydrogenibium sp.]|uniref:ammonium transporter n=1 Tax=Sulfurihydrogenibium sp. TaxID=2053621 RepID=UPI00261FC894|nr:ammonium transporter [Sulfurihydrogenibium sp.]